MDTNFVSPPDPIIIEDLMRMKKKLNSEIILVWSSIDVWEIQF